MLFTGGQTVLPALLEGCYSQKGHPCWAAPTAHLEQQKNHHREVILPWDPLVSAGERPALEAHRQGMGSLETASRGIRKGSWDGGA